MKTTRWSPTDAGSTAGSGAASGPAGGDLGGGYPAPSVTGLQGTPICTTTPTTNDILTFNGTEWCPAAATGGLIGGTPALTFSTTNAAGSASTAVLTDATIALFDTTAPANVTSGTAATGSAGTAARRDHVHYLPFHSEPLTDGASNFIFAAGDIVVVTGVAN